MNNNFEALNEAELMETEAGGIGLVILVVCMGGLGIWNGIKDTADQKK